MVHVHLKGMVITRSWHRFARNNSWSPSFSDTKSELSDQEPAMDILVYISAWALDKLTCSQEEECRCVMTSSHMLLACPCTSPSCDNWASAFFRRHICNLSLVKRS